MHTLNRIFTCLVLIAVLIPPATFALISLDEKNEAQEELEDAIGSAVQTYQTRTYLQYSKTKNEKIVREAEPKLADLEQRKLILRRAIVKEQRIIKTVSDIYGLEIASRDQLQAMISTEKRRVGRLIALRSMGHMAADREDPRTVVLRSMFRIASADWDMALLEDTQTQMLRDLTAADRAFSRLEAAAKEREAVLLDYDNLQTRKKHAEQVVEESTKSMDSIQEIMEDVHNQVLKMQGELARIDARLKAKAERVLIEKGLLDPKDAGGSEATAIKPQFSWPVYGVVSAGFMNSDYKKFFGVPHYGMDIVVGQGTRVSSAAEGVVFLVRDGGETGYSYILVGHRGGYATLYGHISQALVKAGDEVTAGQAIALSGGTPGTHGAGPMTTAAHLHFEVIQAGVNVDPKTVLP